MEAILRLYAQPYDEQYPVVCYDERPCFLIGDRVEGLAMKTEKPRREHYAYEKNGSANVLHTIEPLTGIRITDVKKTRKKKDFALHMERVSNSFPKARKIRVVLDNLNTHNSSSFYETFEAEKAAMLTQRMEFIYTPKSASWLNMVEIDFSALSRQCLDRRIPTFEMLKNEVLAYFKERSAKRVKINWQFTQDDARKKLNRHYSKVNFANQKYKNT